MVSELETVEDGADAEGDFGGVILSFGDDEDGGIFGNGEFEGGAVGDRSAEGKRWQAPSAIHS